LLPLVGGMSLEVHVARRAILDAELAKLEKQIFELEGQYLEETATTGNLLRGWEGCVFQPHMLQPSRKIPGTHLFAIRKVYWRSMRCRRGGERGRCQTQTLKCCPTPSRYFQSISQQRGSTQGRPNRVKNSERIFSLSSVTAPKVRALTKLPVFSPFFSFMSKGPRTMKPGPASLASHQLPEFAHKKVGSSSAHLHHKNIARPSLTPRPARHCRLPTNQRTTFRRLDPTSPHRQSAKRSGTATGGKRTRRDRRPHKGGPSLGARGTEQTRMRRTI